MPPASINFAMRGFGSEFALDLLNKIQTADRDRFRPTNLSRHRLTRECIVYPPAVCLLKLGDLTKTT